MAADGFSHVQPIELAIAAALYVLITRGVKISAMRALILLALLHLTLQHQRHQIVFAAIAPLLLAEPLSQALSAPAAACAKMVVDRWRRSRRLAPIAGLALVLRLRCRSCARTARSRR